jgi:hypothetical protein
MGRQPCCDKVGLKKGPWTAEEDRKLINFILTNGQCCWRAVPKLSGLLRCGKSCRLRWTNYLRPDLKRGLLSDYEEKMVIDLHSQLGNRLTNVSYLCFKFRYVLFLRFCFLYVKVVKDSFSFTRKNRQRNQESLEHSHQEEVEENGD